VIDFEDACLASPAGVALLAALEARERDDSRPFEPPTGSAPVAVDAAVKTVMSMSFGQLCSAAVDAAETLVGPWVGTAADAAATAYRDAEARRPIAAVIAERFDRRLHSPMLPDLQQWWTAAREVGSIADRPPLFDNLDVVYGNGEFSWGGLWTVTAPPEETHDDLVGVWEMFPGPISRWRLPVSDSPRVHEIHRPEDWQALVAAHPAHARHPHGGWELPGPNQRIDQSGLIELPQQRAAVDRLSAHLLPDWLRVADSFDAVHLSWAGFITSEGYVNVADNGSTTMLRYWGSERTHWLRDCFGEPEPLDAPVLSGRVNGDLGVSLLADDHRQTTDRELLGHLLGR
jgi:hypothetical protein